MWTTITWNQNLTSQSMLHILWIVWLKNHTIVTNNHALKGEDNMTQRMNKQMNLTMETREQIVLMVYQG